MSLQDVGSDWLTFPATSWPANVLAVDHFIATVLILTVFLGGIPIGIAGLLLSCAQGPLAQRVRSAVADWMPHLLLFHLTTLPPTVLISVTGLLFGGHDYARSGLAWLLLANVVASVFAIPAWRRMMHEDLRVRLVRHVA